MLMSHLYASGNSIYILIMGIVAKQMFYLEIPHTCNSRDREADKDDKAIKTFYYILLSKYDL